MKEMRNKNVAVSIVVAAVVIGISLFVRPSLSRFISSLIQYEKFETIGSEGGHDEDPGQMIVPLQQVEPK